MHPVQDIKLCDAKYGDTGKPYKYPRFRENAIVRFLLDNGPFDLNQLAVMEFSDENRQQFAQLIGYSLGGYSELHYVDDEAYSRAEQQAVIAGWSPR